MKKVSLMKVNIQQQNVLSKEERKKMLGGANECYAICKGDPLPIPVSNCWAWDETYGSICNGEVPVSCTCS